MQAKEINNGRLAMMAVLAYVVEEAVTATRSHSPPRRSSRLSSLRARRSGTSWMELSRLPRSRAERWLRRFCIDRLGNAHMACECDQHAEHRVLPCLSYSIS